MKLSKSDKSISYLRIQIIPYLYPVPLEIESISLSNRNISHQSLGDIVVPHLDFINEKLMTGIQKTDYTNLIPVSINGPNLEALLFPDLFPDRHGYFFEIIATKIFINLE
ncbi:hypothetical protein Glove_213g178 [Diversispora epigaea]|uniref:Uncharacterized protein n=1 Tax=Diversispora epigaea TaxID=1348612 RepID=A0A397IKH4_9GLOM|nr:hypothetical protein Glove_213g178 [Diversispora epigaea]